MRIRRRKRDPIADLTEFVIRLGASICHTCYGPMTITPGGYWVHPTTADGACPGPRELPAPVVVAR